MIDINECDVGDICWIVLPKVQRAPISGTITKIHKDENAIEVVTDVHGYRIVLVTNAYWDEKEAKKYKKN